MKILMQSAFAVLAVLLSLLCTALASVSAAAELRRAAAAGSAAGSAVRAPGKLRQTGRGWPACDPAVRQYSGYFDINQTSNKHYFYWAFESKNAAATKLLLFLSGGPGCSSGLAALAENGPCLINEATGQLRANPWGWNNEAVVVYLDQPAGVGYSYSDASGGDSDEAEVGHDNNAFVQHLLAAHPAWQQYEVFVYGESYGGHYAPATAHAIWSANRAGANSIKVNLAGLATGNGLVAPVIQYPYYPMLDYDWCMVVRPDHQPCVSRATAEAMNSSVPSCVSACNQCDAGSALACALGEGECNDALLGPYEQTGLNPYDVTQPCQYPPLCYDFSKMTAFFNRADVKAAMGAAPWIQWQTCNMTVNQAFGLDWLRRFDLLIPPMLEDGVRYLNLAGELDMICNWLGNQAVALQLPWSGQAAFNAAPFAQWSGPQGQDFGKVRSVASATSPIQLSFVRVRAAGHMVPYNQPEAASYLINAFMNNQKI